MWRRWGFLATACTVLTWGVLAHAADEPRRVLVVVGPSNHPPGSHEVAAGGRLLAHCLNHAENVRGLTAEIVTAWPEESALAGVSTVVFLGDQFPLEHLPDRDRSLASFGRMADRGCGIVCIHYATGLAAAHVTPTGEHPLLRWMGGYFATRCAHHQSIAKIYSAATIEPAAPEHPVSRGWQPFTLRDEPYIKNYFGPDGPASNVTPIAVSQLPPDAPQREIVAWAVSRGDGGRGVGVVMPHFYRNWQQADLRRLILNGVVWTAKADVPPMGVASTLPDLTTFTPAAVDPKP